MLFSTMHVQYYGWWIVSPSGRWTWDYEVLGSSG